MRPARRCGCVAGPCRCASRSGARAPRRTRGRTTDARSRRRRRPGAAATWPVVSTVAAPPELLEVEPVRVRERLGLEHARRRSPVARHDSSVQFIDPVQNRARVARTTYLWCISPSRVETPCVGKRSASISSGSVRGGAGSGSRPSSSCSITTRTSTPRRGGRAARTCGAPRSSARDADVVEGERASARVDSSAIRAPRPPPRSGRRRGACAPRSRRRRRAARAAAFLARFAAW